MSVQFEEEQNFNNSYNKSVSKSSSGGLTSWIIKNGWAKDEKGANAMMIIIMLLCFALAIFLIYQTLQ